MRLRKKPRLQADIEEYRDIVLTEQLAPKVLQEKSHIELEIGCGRGGFIAARAALCPRKLFVGIESQLDIAYYAARTIRSGGGENVFIVNSDAGRLDNWFRPGQVDCVYINFCDPWPKERHAKRRLTGRRFLAKYRQVIAPDGCLYFKTDNKALFEFSLREFAACGLFIKRQSENLHASGFDNPVWTEYETKFAGLGLPVYFCEAVFSA